MSHGITQNDQMFSVRQVPWHGPGRRARAPAVAPPDSGSSQILSGFISSLPDRYRLGVELVTTPGKPRVEERHGANSPRLPERGGLAAV
jgi:hypothetical protein